MQADALWLRVMRHVYVVSRAAAHTASRAGGKVGKLVLAVVLDTPHSQAVWRRPAAARLASWRLPIGAPAA